MSRWATFIPNAAPDEVHVVPIDADDAILNGHVCTRACPCQPVLDEVAFTRGDPVIVHNDPERGGYNA